LCNKVEIKDKNKEIKKILEEVPKCKCSLDNINSAKKKIKDKQ
jgi:hypothetical protein